MARRAPDEHGFIETGAWRRAEPVWDRVRVKPYEEALAEAKRQLVKPDAYELGDWSWGFREPAGNADPEEMRLVYEFAFSPIETVDRSAHPPCMVEVLGEEEALSDPGTDG